MGLDNMNIKLNKVQNTNCWCQCDSDFTQNQLQY